MEDIWQTYNSNGEDVWVWGVESTGADNLDVADFITSNGGSFPGFSSIDNDTLFSFYDINYTPTYIIICPDKTFKSAAVESVGSYIPLCQSNSVDILSSSILQDKLISINTNNDITVYYSLSENSKVVFELYDILGNKIHNETVFSASGKHKINFNKGDLLNGYYFIRMTKHNGNVYTNKFVIY